MANVLKREKQIQILRCLVEGNSIRSTSRITGVTRNAILRLLARFGADCHNWLNQAMGNLALEHVECDEIWTFVGKKDKRLTGSEERAGVLGSQYAFIGIDKETRLIACYTIGKRNHNTTAEFVRTLERRMVHSPDRQGDQRPQISTDGWGSYLPTIAGSFDGTVRHGVLIKGYVNPEVGRYAPPDLKSTDRISINGISDLRSICTSHIERHNLTVRLFIKRFTRLTLGFSKKLANLKAAFALHVAYYNYCWRLREPGKSGKLKPTPAMQAGLTDTLWDIERLYDEISGQSWRDEKSRRMARLLAAMKRQG